MARFRTRHLTLLGLVLSFAVAMVVLPPSAQARRVPADFFGMHDSQISWGSVPGVEVGAVRLWDTGTAWRQIETRPGVFNWSAVDAAVGTARNADLRPLLVLGQTPRFHALRPKAPGSYGRGATSMPQIRAWKRYVKAVAKRYGTTVDYQVWNEPNVVNYWTGSVSQMAELTATASRAIRDVAGRRATVVAPSFPLRLESQQKWFRQYWSATADRRGMASYVDVVSVNAYALADQPPEATMALLRLAQRMLPKAARAKPLWNTEINYGLLGGATAKRISGTTQAAFVARTLLLNAAGPVRRVYWYAWRQGPIANTHLVQDDGTTLTRAGRAWQVTRGWILGTDLAGCQQAGRGRSAGLYTCTARVSRTEVRRFFWKPSGPATTVVTPRSTRSWTALSGHQTTRSGRFAVKVGQSPVLVTSRR